MSKWSQSPTAVFTELERCLVVTCPGALLPKVMSAMRAETLSLCERGAFRAVVLDLSAVDLLDLTEWSELRALSAGVRLMGSEAWLVGLQPSVVESLMMMNAQVEGLQYAMRVESVLEIKRLP